MGGGLAQGGLPALTGRSGVEGSDASSPVFLCLAVMSSDCFVQFEMHVCSSFAACTFITLFPPDALCTAQLCDRSSLWILALCRLEGCLVLGLGAHNMFLDPGSQVPMR